MKEITVILCGTIHDTLEETKLFGILNVINKKNIHWLCEGESNNRNCTSIKDNTVHLLTDSLFVNMLILDFVRENSKNINDEFIEILYERVIELFVTISNFDNNNKVQDLVKPKYQEYIKLIKNNTPINEIYDKIKSIPIGNFMIDMRELVAVILKFMKDKNMIDKNYEKCVFEFYDTGLTCEDKILTVLREESFIKLILQKINSISDGKHIILVTVGLDHCTPLSILLRKFYIKTKIVDFTNLY